MRCVVLYICLYAETCISYIYDRCNIFIFKEKSVVYKFTNWMFCGLFYNTTVEWLLVVCFTCCPAAQKVDILFWMVLITSVGGEIPTVLITYAGGETPTVLHRFIVKPLSIRFCAICWPCVHFVAFHNARFDGIHVRCLLSMQSVTSLCQIANRFWQDTSEKHYSHNNRGERSLCGDVLTKLTRPFTAFDTELAASHNGRHINLQMSSGKLKCHRFSQQHQRPARGIID